MNPHLIQPDESKEYMTNERCYILELLNNPETAEGNAAETQVKVEAKPAPPPPPAPAPPAPVPPTASALTESSPPAASAFPTKKKRNRNPDGTFLNCLNQR